VLFGSRARGDHRPDSDVDLAVRAASPDNRTPLGVYIQHCQEWRSELAGMFGLGVDLDTLEAPLETIGANLQRDGQVVFLRGGSSVVTPES
jgi:predicted nucleotidyltransferase